MRHPSSWTVFPQTELQEVLGADEETGLLDGSEATSPDLSEERAQDITEQPAMQTAFQQALPAVPQVGFTEGPACVLAPCICEQYACGMAYTAELPSNCQLLT